MAFHTTYKIEEHLSSNFINVIIFFPFSAPLFWSEILWRLAFIPEGCGTYQTWQAIPEHTDAVYPSSVSLDCRRVPVWHREHMQAPEREQRCDSSLQFWKCRATEISTMLMGAPTSMVSINSWLWMTILIMKGNCNNSAWVLILIICGVLYTSSMNLLERHKHYFNCFALSTIWWYWKVTVKKHWFPR